MSKMFDLTTVTFVDLTHELTPGIPTWSGKNEFEQKNIEFYTRGFLTQTITTPLGIGTHVDAPSHHSRVNKFIHELPLSTLIAPSYILDVSKKANEKYLISPEDILSFEASVGIIPQNSIFIAYTGWSQFWSDPQKYCNQDKDGIRHFPSFSKDACELLLERNVSGIGIDTLSPDSSDPEFPAHKLMLQKNKFIIENLANCNQLPPKGAWVFVLPMKIKYGSEAPVRAIGLVQK